MPRGPGYGDYAEPTRTVYRVQGGQLCVSFRDFTKLCHAKAFARDMVEHYGLVHIFGMTEDGQPKFISTETPYKGELENIIA